MRIYVGAPAFCLKNGEEGTIALELPCGATVSDAARAAGVKEEFRASLTASVGWVPVSWDRELMPEDTLRLLPFFEGG